MTDGRGADRCIDTVDAERMLRARLTPFFSTTKASVFLATDRAHVLREGADLVLPQRRHDSVPGVYIGFSDSSSFRRVHEQRPDDKEEPDTHETLHSQTAGQNGLKRARSILHL